MMLKESLVKTLFLFLGIYLTNNQTNLKEEECKVINLICNEEKVEYVSDKRLEWNDFGFTNYKKLNHENIVNFERKDFELDLWFDEAQKAELSEKVQSYKSTKIQKNVLPKNITLISKDYGQLRRTVYSFSQPIFQQGKDGNLYAFILVSQTFESEGTTKYFFLQKNDGKWKIRGMRIIGFS